MTSGSFGRTLVPSVTTTIQLLVFLAKSWPTIRDSSCDFVDRLIVVAKATIHESTRNPTKNTPDFIDAGLKLQPKVALSNLRNLWMN
jgi:hypothetical protein